MSSEQCKLYIAWERPIGTDKWHDNRIIHPYIYDYLGPFGTKIVLKMIIAWFPEFQYGDSTYPHFCLAAVEWLYIYSSEYSQTPYSWWVGIKVWWHPWVQSTSPESKSWMNAWFRGTDHDFLCFSVVFERFTSIEPSLGDIPQPLPLPSIICPYGPTPHLSGAILGILWDNSSNAMLLQTVPILIAKCLGSTWPQVINKV